MTTTTHNTFVKHVAAPGHRCLGDATGCAEATREFYASLKVQSPTINHETRVKATVYLESGDGPTLNGCFFQHLRNVEEMEMKTWCPMADHALTFVAGWDEATFKRRGLTEFLTDLTNICAWCGSATDTMHICSRCKSIRYCSRTCQRAHWKQSHKRTCQ